MNILNYIKTNGWVFDCEIPKLVRTFTVDIGFINSDGAIFCKENGFKTNTVQYVTVVATSLVSCH